MLREVKRFTLEPLTIIVSYLEQQLAKTDRVCFLAPHPDLGRGRYAGAHLEEGVHRPLRVWLDLAELLCCRVLLPEKIDETHVKLCFEKLTDASLHESCAPITEKYGVTSGFQQINKLEDPWFLLSYREALARVALKPGARVLSLGVNRADELEPLGALDATFIGIDHSETILQVAARRFKGDNYNFINLDINRLDTLRFEPFDLVLALSVLQSPAVNDREVLRFVVARLLKKSGCLMVGWPNGRFVDGEQHYGARMKNYTRPDLSLLVKDLAFYKKYLQQHGFKVCITGKYELLITAIPAAG